MQKLSSILPKIVQKYELDSNATASQVLEAAEKYLQDVLGKENVGEDKKVFGKKLQNGLLFFEVSSSAWNHKLYFEKTKLLEHLRNKFSKITLRDIRGIVRGEE